MHPRWDMLELMWVGGLAAASLALIVALVSRCIPTRPATRHLMWTAVLLSFLTPALGLAAWRPGWLSPRRVGEQVERLGDAAGGLASLFGTIVRQPDEVTVAQPVGGIDRSSPREPIVEHAASTPLHAAMSALPAPIARRNETTAAPERGDSSAPRSLPEPPPDGSGLADRGTHAHPRLFANAIPGAAATLHPEPPVPATHAAPAIQRRVERAASPRAVPSPAPRATSLPTSPASDLSSLRADAKRVASVLPPPPATRESPLPTGAKSAWDELAAWARGLASTARALVAIPPLPALVWGGSMFAALCVVALRWTATAREARRGREPDGELLHAIRAASRTIGLKRVPRAVVVDRCVSPMICCGVRPTLVIPAPLWAELDDASRRAVIVHELAHLKRGDHWLCWLELLVCAAYWWHPVAWWVSRRIRDEADACCDAWVTSVLPGSRRAYAEALLTTRSFVDQTASPTWGLTLGVLSGRARKLARRVTMVMTEHAVPRASLVGMALAVCVAGAGAFVTPSLACPEDDEKTPKAVVVVRAKGGVSCTQSSSCCDNTGGAAEAPETEFLGEAPALEALLGGASSDADDRLRAIEERLLRIEADFMRIQEVLGAEPSGLGALVPFDGTAPEPVAPFALAFGQLSAPSNDEPSAWAMGGAPVAPFFGEATTPFTDAEPTEPREYALPEGKLEALVTLMEREDVPVLVGQQGDRIIVHATPCEHNVFAAFLRLIDPEGEHGQEAMSLYGAGGATAPSANIWGLSTTEAARVGQDYVRVYQHQARDLARALADYERAGGQLEGEAERFEALAESLRERGDALREQADELREQAREIADDARRAGYYERARAMLEEAVHAESQALEMDAQAAHAEVRLSEIEAQLESLEAQLESAEEMIEQVSGWVGEEAWGEIAESVEASELVGDSESSDETSECEEATDCDESSECESEESEEEVPSEGAR